MNKNSWQSSMYDEDYARSTLHSATLKRKALEEVRFLIAALSLQPKAKVLDIPCGTGRHSHLLARKGLLVTGLDISEACLEIARSDPPHKNLTFRKGDMSDLRDYKDSCDVLINLFSSFGYFATDAQNKKVLRGFYEALKEGGKIALQTINREWLLNIYSQNDWNEHQGKYILNKRKYNSKTHYSESWMKVIDTKDSTESEYYHRIRLYEKNELVELLKEVGFKKIKVFGDAKGGRFTKYESSHPFYKGTK